MGYFSLPLIWTHRGPNWPLLPPCAHIRRGALFVHVLKENVIKRERPVDGFMIYQKHFTIWQSSLEQISKCLLYERRPEILLIQSTSAGDRDAQVT